MVSYYFRYSIENALPYTPVLYLLAASPSIEPISPVKVTSERWTELKCNVSGNPKPKLTWLRQDVPIGASNPKYLVLPSGSLRIFEVKPSDSGTYTCVASNPLGVARQPVELFVQGEKKNFLSLRWFLWRWPGNKSFFRWANDKEAGKTPRGTRIINP